MEGAQTRFRGPPLDASTKCLNPASGRGLSETAGTRQRLPEAPVSASQAEGRGFDPRRPLSPLRRPGFGELAARLHEVFGKHLHVGEHGHEVRVAGPAWNEMEVDVIGHPRTGDAAEVPAEVVTLRRVDLGECAHRL